MPQEEQAVRLNIYDLLLLLSKWKKLFIINFILAAGISAVVAMLLPVYYRAESVILPPSGSGGGLPSFLSKDISGIASNFGLEMPSEEIYQSILRSRTLKERIIERFRLRDVWKMSPEVKPEDLLRAFEQVMQITTREDQSIEVSVVAKDPKLAADIANGTIEELDKVYRDITGKTAHNNRIFIEKRIAEVTDSLKSLQDILISFQKTNRLLALDAQLSAMVNAAADLKAQQLATDIELDVLKNSMGIRHPQVAQMSARSRELSNRYEAVLAGREGDLFLSLQELPEAYREYADLSRKVRVQASLLDFIYPQYENARILEDRETANVQVLDFARTPQKKYKPARRVIVMTTCALSLLCTLALIILIEYYRKLPEKNARDYEKLNKAFSNLIGRK